jgi:cytochrome b pre-mRNA-processing protein 3
VQDAKNNVKKRIDNFFKMDIENLYSKTLIDSRNPDIFKNHLPDDLNHKVLVFLIFLSKIFNNVSKNDQNYQKFFDYIFNRIEIDLRELGYGDMSVNKKMKIIVTKFYSILVDFKNFPDQAMDYKRHILSKYFSKIEQMEDFIEILNKYFAIDNVTYNDS